MVADHLMHAVTYGTPAAGADDRRMDTLQDDLARLMGEGAPADDPRVAAAVRELAQLLAAKRLANRIAGAMGG